MFSRNVLGWQVEVDHMTTVLVGSLLLTPVELACGVGRSCGRVGSAPPCDSSNASLTPALPL
jgi:hypothetical protein